MRCFAYSFPYSFDQQKLLMLLEPHFDVQRFADVVHIRAFPESVGKDEGDVFFFYYGALVSWGLTEDQELRVREIIKDCFNTRLGAIDDELCTYDYGQEASIHDDHIILPDRDVLTKLACSHGLAQSVKLGGFENTILQTIESTRALPESLAQEGKIPLSRKEIRQMMGRIFMDRSSINLHLEFLDVPNFFWENTELEHLHEMISDYMGQEHRVEILNQRLEVMQELLDILASEVNHQHSSKLEWIIIVLIFAEVALVLTKDFLKFFTP